MDIRKWLAETEVPVSSELPEWDRFLLPRQPGTVPDARRRRKHSSSDSSLSKVASPQPRRKGDTAKKLDGCEIPDVVNERPSDTSHSISGRSTSSSYASQRYARKPRRKTREDKYDVGSGRGKERDSGRRASRKSESKKSKRKSRRRKDGKTHNGIGQEFQAKNVSRDRLTLKPSDNVGLFSKGRSSTSIRGRGLPDLVFSKMKFLQNHHGGNDDTTQALDSKKKQKKDHARTEEDISAFFTSTRPALVETDGNILADSACPTGPSARAKTDRPRPMQDPSRVSGTAVPTVESETKASYLGFGSRGPHPESTNYFSWSKSIRAPSIAPGKPMGTLTDQDKAIDAQVQETHQIPPGRGTSVHQNMPSSVVDGLVTATSNRVRLSSVAPMPQGMLRSQSLPQSSSSPARNNLANHSVNPHTYQDVHLPSSMPPVSQDHLLTGRKVEPGTEGSVMTCHKSDRLESMRRRSATDVWSQDSGRGRHTLIELGETSRYYNDMSEAELQQAQTRKGCRTEVQPSARLLDTERQSRRSLYCRTAEVPTVRFAAPDIGSSGLQNFPCPSIYVQQEQRQRQPGDLAFEDNGGYCYSDGDVLGQEYMSEAGMLDHEDFEDLLDGQVPYGLTEELDDDVEDLDYVADGVDQVQEREHASVATPSFWRPNRLY